MSSLSTMTVEQLNAYVAQLPPTMLAPLLSEFEKVHLAEPSAALDLVIPELRSALREVGLRADRIGSPSRLFFQPAQSFLVDDMTGDKDLACEEPVDTIARASLQPIWLWLCSDLMPTDAKSYIRQAKRVLLVDDRDAAKRLAREFQQRVASVLPGALGTPEGLEQAGERLAAYLAPPRALADLQSLHRILSARFAPMQAYAAA